MTWTYSQSDGTLNHDGRSISRGYSGKEGPGRNNGSMEGIQNVGPIPRGHYKIGRPHNTSSHGPHVMSLTAVGHIARGRSAFLIHGDNHKHDASTGCVIMPPQVRDQISRSGDTDLEVVR